MQLDVWSDFVCPWCYLAYTSVEKLASTHPVEVTWHSYELLPVGAPPMPDAYRQAPSDGQGILQRNGRWRRNISATKYGPFAFRVSRKVTSRLRGHSPEKTRHRMLFPWRNRAMMTRGLKWPIALTSGVKIAPSKK